MIVTQPASTDSDRPAADFLTQLIACDRHLPAYRTIRRTDATAAATAYQCETAHHDAVFQRLV